MDTSATRQAIADALSTVADITGYVRVPSAPRPGDGWPLWAGAERAEAFCFYQNWRVLVAMPGDEAAASEMSDARVGQIVDALEDADVLYIQSMTPVVVATSAGDTLALQITGRTE